ncbi:MAG: SDR family NAD(P)-dependent oxidoreductase, partial [Bacillota bacterium]
MRVDGKAAVVTGAGQGIGRAIALKLASEGADVAIVDVNLASAEKVAEEVRAIGRKSVAIQADVTRSADVDRAISVSKDTFGSIDILVNNAGISPKRPGGVRYTLATTDEESWDKTMAVNLKGPFLFSKAVMPIMAAQKSGKIVSIASIVGITGGADSPSSPHYAISKAAVICLTKCLAREMAQHNVNVNAVAPGRIATEMAAKSSPEANALALKSTPLGRFGTPEDVANAVLFLASAESDWMT